MAGFKQPAFAVQSFCEAVQFLRLFFLPFKGAGMNDENHLER